MTADKTCRSWGIRVELGTPDSGDKLEKSGQPIGRVTSSTWSPFQACGVGIVHLNNTHLGPGAVVDVQCTDGTLHRGELCTLPMYDPKGEIVRGINKIIPTGPDPWVGIPATASTRANAEPT